MRLVLNNFEQLYQKNQENLLLGNWCDPDHNKSFKKIIHKYHWENTEKLEKDYKYLDKLKTPVNDGKVIAGAGTLPNLQNIVRFSMEGAIKINTDVFDMSSIPPECIMTDLTNDDNEDTKNIHPYLRLKVESRDVEYQGKTYESLVSFSKRDSPIHCEIIDVRNPSKTIICTYDHQPRLFVPLKNKNGYYLRCLLPDELKQIQGFPGEFKIAGNKKDKIKQVGNAVPPPLIKLIVKQFLTMSTNTTE